MKRMIFLLVAWIMSAGVAFADNDKSITVEQFPDAAKQFIATYFPDVKVAYAKMETDFFDKSYEVIFINGDKVEFDDKGAWSDVNCKFTEVPAGIIPQQIKSYIAANYPDVKIVEIDRDKYNYEVKLNNKLELTFDLQFNLIDIDD